jgi:hypothetical protein
LSHENDNCQRTLVFQGGGGTFEAGTYQYIYRKRKEEVEEAYNSYIKRIEAKDISPDRNEKLISPGRDIVALVSEADNAKHVSNSESAIKI